MNEDQENELTKMQLRAALPKWQNDQLEVDLWPRMLGRLEYSPARFGLFEFSLSGLIALAFAINPKAIVLLFYNL